MSLFLPLYNLKVIKDRWVKFFLSFKDRNKVTKRKFGLEHFILFYQ